jgi:hypothetical protein
MNFERGFFRFWIVLSAIWVLFVAVPLLVYWPDVEPSYHLAQGVLANLGVSLPETAGYSSTDKLLMFLGVTFLPPAGLFVLSLLLIWILEGFRKNA